MNISKKVLAQLDMAYSISLFDTCAGARLAAASEGLGGCFLCDLNGEKREQVWENAGGTMTICQTEEDGSFLAVQNFFKGFNAADACIVHCFRHGGKWHVRKILDLPYVHRFHVFEIGLRRFLGAATLCRSKAFKDDWESPGQFLVTELFSDYTVGEIITVIPELTKNHGFEVRQKSGGTDVLITGMEGVFQVDVPDDPQGQWNVRQIFNKETSEAILFDFDGDGYDELCVIEPFHGGTFSIYHGEGNVWEKVYGLPIDFGHVLWGGCVDGLPTLLLGYRGENAALLALRKVPDKEPGTYSVQTQIVDEGEGITNITVDNSGDSLVVFGCGGINHRVLRYKINEI